MAGCWVCNTPDGWNRFMTNWKGQTVPICTRHFRAGCEKCGKPFDGGPDRRPVEVRLMDNGPDGGPSDDSILVCAECQRKMERKRP